MEPRLSNPARLVDAYLREIRVSAWNRGLPRARTEQLVHEVGSKIESALATAASRDEATVYGVLDRMGPPSAFVAHLADEPRSGVRGLIDRLLAPVARLGYAHGWGPAEIGALLLLIVGPFYVWWIGPIFGIILVRVAADRWSTQATHRATNFLVALFAVQALVAVGLFVYVLIAGGPLESLMEQVFSLFNLRFGVQGGVPLFLVGGGGPMSPVQLLLASPPFVAGIASGIYLALSPRKRPTT